MRNGDNHHYYHHQSLNIQKTTFLPMLCSRPSIKDVAIPRLEEQHHRRSSSSSSSSLSNDPLSPKIGCMGQVKIRNNKIIGFPPTTTSTASTPFSSHNKLALTSKNSYNVKYFKLKKLFSSKNMTNKRDTPTTTTATSSCRRREVIINSVHKRRPPPPPLLKFDERINIVDMDPPLPVVKRVAKPEDGNGDNNSIWKRRSSGGALKSLDLQRIQIPRQHQMIEINTV